MFYNNLASLSTNSHAEIENKCFIERIAHFLNFTVIIILYTVVVNKK